MPDVPETPEQWEQRIAETKARAEQFERLYTEETIERELRKAAEDAGAFNPDQIITLPKGKSRLVEAGDKQVVRVVSAGDDGKENGSSTSNSSSGGTRPNPSPPARLPPV